MRRLETAATVHRMQNEELSYAIVTPYSMRKSRTGGIIARLIPAPVWIW